MGFIVVNQQNDIELVLQDNEKLLYKDEKYHLVSLKMNDNRYLIYNYKSNMKEVIDITDNINQTKKIIDQYFNELLHFNNLILDGKKIISDNLYLKITKQQNEDLYVKLIQNDKIIGSRSSSFNPLETFFKLGVLTVSGSSSLLNDYIGQGLGLKMYETIDKILPYQQIPHGYAGSPGSLTSFSKNFWSKRKQYLAFPDIIEEKINIQAEIEQFNTTLSLNEEDILKILNLSDEKFDFRLYNSQIVPSILYKNLGENFTKKDAINKLSNLKEKDIKNSLYLFDNNTSSFQQFKENIIKTIKKNKKEIVQNINWNLIENYYNKQVDLINKSFAYSERSNMLFVQNNENIIAYNKGRHSDIIQSHILYSSNEPDILNRIKNNIKSIIEQENYEKLVTYLRKLSVNLFEKNIWTDTFYSLSCNSGLYSIVDTLLCAQQNQKNIYIDNDNDTILLLNKNDIILDEEKITPLSFEDAKIQFMTLWKENVKGNIKDVFNEISNHIKNPDGVKLLEELLSFITPIEISTYGKKYSHFLKNNNKTQTKILKTLLDANEEKTDKNDFS